MEDNPGPDSGIAPRRVSPGLADARQFMRDLCPRVRTRGADGEDFTQDLERKSMNGGDVCLVIGDIVVDVLDPRAELHILNSSSLIVAWTLAILSFMEETQA